MELIKHVLDDRTVYHTPDANFLVQVANGSSSYQTRYCFTDLPQAVEYFNSISIGRDAKKRLLMRDCGKVSTLARAPNLVKRPRKIKIL